MSGHDITTAFMIATPVMVAVCALAALLRKAALEVFAAGVVVFVFTVISRMWSGATDLPISAIPWPVQDVICGVLAALLYVRHREVWKLAFALAFGVQSVFHVSYWWVVLSQGGPTREQNVSYLWGINTPFAFELMVLTLAAGGHIASHVLDLLRVSGGFGPGHHHGVAGGR